MTTAVKRACDACHRRKVKCDGINPCRNCSASQLSCTYNAIPQKKGPKGSRAKVISELRETQRQTSLSVKVQSRINGLHSPATAPSLVPTPGLLTPEVVKECLEFYFGNMYQQMPILHRQRLEQQALYMDQSPDTYCLLTSLCAFTMLQPGMTVLGSDPYSMENMPGANIVSGTLLMEETIRVRRGSEYLDSPTLNTLCTSYFLFGCYYAMEMHDKAWFQLREATTLIHLIGMNKEETYLQYDNIEAARRRRLFWLFFVTERAYALQRNRPLTLQATINLPALADDPTDPLAHLLSGFTLLASLFRPFDGAFITLWNKARGDCSASHTAALHKQLQEVLPGYLNSPASQLAQMRMDQQWLKQMQWQMSMANGNPSEIYTMDVGRDSLNVVAQLPGNLGLVGVGLLEKLCELSISLTEYLVIQPVSRDPFSVGPREQLHQLLNIVAMLRNGDHHFWPLLLCKVHDILPKLVNPMLQNAPENACNIDIFDGFGNAGMAQPTMYHHADDYDNKYAMSRMDEMSNDTGSSNGAMSVKSEMKSSPFAGSSAIMSPTVDMPHGLQTDYNGMQGMVLNQMGGSPTSLDGQHMATFQSLSPPMTMGQQQAMGMNGQGLGLMGPTGGMMGRPQPQHHRTNSFAMSSAGGAPPQLRTVADFHVMQRANSDMTHTMGSLGITNMGQDMDFSPLPR